MNETSKRMEDDIRSMKKDIEFIKNHMIDNDSIMTEDDYKALLDYRKEKETGKLITQDEIEKELDL